MARRHKSNTIGALTISCIFIFVSVAVVNAQSNWVPSPKDGVINEYVMAWIETPRMARVIIHGCVARETGGAIRIVVPVQAQSSRPDGRDEFIPDRAVASYIAFNQDYTCEPGEGFNIVNVMLHAQPARAKFDDDAVKLDPNHNQVLFENDVARVVRVRFLPGESGPVVDKRARVIVPLTDSHASVTLPDGHSEVRDAIAGSITFGIAGRQGTKNSGTTPLENIVVELKGK